MANRRGEGRIGDVPQTVVIDPSLPVTVQDFLALTRQRRPVCFGVRPSTRRRVTELLEQVGLVVWNAGPFQCSQAVNCARAAADAVDPVPERLILDEPASGLDEGRVHLFEELLRALSEAGYTVLMVSHDIDQVRHVADSVTSSIGRSSLKVRRGDARPRSGARLDPFGGEGRART